jgi:hypothetical protein
MIKSTQILIVSFLISITSFAQVFKLDTINDFPDLINSSHDWADIDSDGDKDLIIGGWNLSYNNEIKLYKNNGNGVFDLDTSQNFIGLGSLEIRFSDINGDGFEDVISVGYFHLTGVGWVSDTCLMYLNDGVGNFSYSGNNNINVLGSATFELADIDGDLDLDLILAGDSAVAAGAVRLFKNDGTGFFILQPSSVFDGLLNGQIEFVDIDNDGDQDLFMLDRSPSQTSGEIFQYLNNGLGEYTKVTGVSMGGGSSSNFVVKDINQDGDLDLVTSSGAVYINNGSGMMSTTTIGQINSGLIAVSDVGNSNPLIVVSNSGGVNLFETNIISSANVTFNLMSYSPFNFSTSVDIEFVDVDGDGDEDYFLTQGWEYSSGEYILSELYLNVPCDTVDLDINWVNGTLVSDQFGAQYRWYNCQTGNLLAEVNRHFTPNYNGDYAVILTKNGCVDTSACFSVMDVGIEGVTAGDEFQVYPTITSNFVHVKSKNESATPCIFNVFDLTGKLVHTMIIASGNSEFIIDASNWNSGLYLYRIDSESEVIQSGKISKENF